MIVKMVISQWPVIILNINLNSMFLMLCSTSCKVYPPSSVSSRVSIKEKGIRFCQSNLLLTIISLFLWVHFIT